IHTIGESLALLTSPFSKWSSSSFTIFLIGTLVFFSATTTNHSATDADFNNLKQKWRDTLIADVTSSKATSSINTRASGHQTTMLYTITAIKVINGGLGYTSAPSVEIVGGGGSGATATATLSGDKVSSITIVSGGSRYTTTPSINLTGGGGTGASASPVVAIWSDLPPAAQTGVSADVASGNIADSFKRLEYMAQAYAISGCALYQNASLLAAITGGLDWLTSNVYTPTGTLFGNWYDWEVSAPQSLNNAAILLLSNLSALSSTQIANYVKAVYNFGPDSVNQKDYFYWGALTGANTSNAALTMAIQGILLGNNTTTVTRFWHDTAGHPDNPQTDYVVSGTLLLDEARGNLSGNNPLDFDGKSVFTTVTSGDGFYADGSFIYHFDSNLLGGIKRGVLNQWLVDMSLLFHSEKILGFNGGSLFVNFQGHEGKNPSSYLTGDALIFDGLSSPNFVQLSEYWFQQKIGKFSATFGRIDALNNFAFTKSADLILNNAEESIPT
ncbi:MAG: hypothetical protein EBY83_06370, partial [Verrucomicrobia bacterium]|nr:hypothetical protein [Verrucomicrobiota bacterium]